MKRTSTYDIAIVGGGLAGLIAAKLIVDAGFSTALIAPRDDAPDGRTTALLADSVALLEEAGIWPAVEKRASALRVMRIIDGTSRLIRAPQIDFHASEIDLEAFGYNIENRYLSEQLHAMLAGTGGLTLIDDKAAGVSREAGGSALLQLSSGDTLAAGLLVAADGRHSVIRQALGIRARNWRYPQTALVGNFSHSLPHGDVSTEFHTESGPLTLVPLQPPTPELPAEKCSSLVCVVSEEEAPRIMALEGPALAIELERRMHSVLGKVRPLAPLKPFPLSGMIAERFGAGNTVLIGEAAHVFPPIGAQGLNLGLRDVRTLHRLLLAYRPEGAEGGAAITDRFGAVGDAYHRARNSDIKTRTASVDLLNRSLLTAFLPVQFARSLGLAAIGDVGPLRRLLMREGIAPGSSLRAVFGARQRRRAAYSQPDRMA